MIYLNCAKLREDELLILQLVCPNIKRGDILEFETMKKYLDFHSDVKLDKILDLELAKDIISKRGENNHHVSHPVALANRFLHEILTFQLEGLYEAPDLNFNNLYIHKKMYNPQLSNIEIFCLIADEIHATKEDRFESPKNYRIGDLLELAYWIYAHNQRTINLNFTECNIVKHTNSEIEIVFSLSEGGETINVEEYVTDEGIKNFSYE